MKIKAPVFSILLLVSGYVFSQTDNNLSCYIKDPKGSIREHNCDFIKLNLTVHFEPENGKVIGSAEYEFSPIQQKVDSLFLDGPGILADHVLLDNKSTRFKMDSAGITVFFDPSLTWNTTHTLSIGYTATPRKGLYFIGWNKPITTAPDDPNRTRKEIWTQGQGVDNRFWIPSYDDVDDKLITALNITFDKKYTVVSNGNLITATENRDGSKTWFYSMEHPHSLYLIMLAIAEYKYKDFTSKNGITTRQYYYPDRENTIEQTYKYSSEMMDWLQNEIGIPYPWGSYSNVPVQDYMYGAMENTTATIYTDYFLQDDRETGDRKYYAVSAHELTHQWFGDYITEFSSTHHWLHESFATYYSKKFRQATEGEDVYQWIRRDEMNQAWDADAKDHLPVANSDAGSARQYPKGSLVLDMMRYVVGDEQFRKAIKEYLLSHPYTNVETNDLKMQFMKTLGINLDWFFDEWIYKGGYPEYTVDYSVGTNQTTVNVKQTQKTDENIGLFKMPIHIQVHYKDGSFDDVLPMIQNQSTTINIPNKNNKPIAFVLFNPDMPVYCKINFTKTYDELKWQAFNAPNMIDRYDAIAKMRSTALDQKRTDLITIYQKETFYAIKDEIIIQLLSDTDKGSMAIIKKALSDPDENVRRTVMANTKVIPKKLEKDYESMLSDHNYINIEIALERLCEINPDKKQKYLDATKTMMGANKNIRIAWLQIACGMDKTKYISELTAYAGYSYEFRTRTTAMNALKTLNYCDADVVNNLFDALLSGNSRLRNNASATLKYFMETKDYYDLIGKTFNSTDWEDWQRERVATIFPKK